MEQVRFASRHGYPKGFSARGIIVFVLTVLITAFLWVTFSSQPAHAAPGAAWSGGNILYENHAYAQAGPSINKKLGLDEKATVYSYIPQNGSGPNTSSNDAFFIYFAPGVDPPKATTAKYVVYTLQNGTYTNARDHADVPMTPKGDEDSYQSACSVSGIGWIICPVSVFLADSMDWLFGVISNTFLAVKPLTLNTDASNGLYTAWNIMRTIANVAFAIAFIIIIYSQLTGIGLNNYGIKKLIPRLVVAAILVNLSFYISALAIDISNILGYSFQDVFNNIREDVFNITDDTNGMGGNMWANLTAVILGGGGIIYGVGYAAVSGAIFGLAPMLVFLMLTLFVVLVVLAARQAIIILLVVLAPLAFVANLLPNTEDLYRKWQKLFMTMLVFFPAFSLLFGGAQLAGAVIIQNANGNIVTVLFGLAVQVAPLAITPLMFKLGGSLLARIGQLANNPNKGLIDRTRKWADRKGALMRAQTASRTPKSAFGRSVFNPASAMRKMDDGAKNDVDSTKAYEQESENRRHSQRRYGHIYERQAVADARKTAIHNDHEAHVEHLKNTPGSVLHGLTLNVEASKLKLDAVKADTETMLAREKTSLGSNLNVANITAENAKLQNEKASASLARTVEEFKSGKLPLTGELGQLTSSMKQATIDLAAEKQGLNSAQYEVSRNINTAMNAETIAGEALRSVAGGVGGAQAQVRARAQAVSSLNKLDNDALNANVELLKANAAQAGTTIKKYSAGIVEAVIAGQGTYDNKQLNSEVIHAALQAQALEKNMSLFEKVRGSANFDQALVSEVIADNSTNFKIAGGFHLQEDPTLNINAFGGDTVAFNKKMALSRIQSLGNAGAENLSSLKASWVSALADPLTIQAGIDEAKAAGDYESLIRAYNVVKRGLTNKDILAKIDDREIDVRKIEKALANAFGEDATKDPNEDLLRRVRP